MVSREIFMKYITNLVDNDDLYTVEISQDELHFKSKTPKRNDEHIATFR